MNKEDFCSYCGTELEWDDDGDVDDEGKQIGGWYSFCPKIFEIENNSKVDDQKAIAEMKKHDGHD